MSLAVPRETLQADADERREAHESQHEGAGNAKGREPNVVAGFILPVIRKIHAAEKAADPPGLGIVDRDIERPETLVTVAGLNVHVKEAAPEPHVEG